MSVSGNRPFFCCLLLPTDHRGYLKSPKEDTMKRLFLITVIAVAGGIFYGIIVPRAWHADDAQVFGESRKQHAHDGAVALAMFPLFGGGLAVYLRRKMKQL
jgi:hypothetical protein